MNTQAEDHTLACEGMVAVIAVWVILGESMTTQQALGGTLILCGLMLMRMSRKGR